MMQITKHFVALILEKILICRRYRNIVSFYLCQSSFLSFPLFYWRVRGQAGVTISGRSSRDELARTPHRLEAAAVAPPGPCLPKPQLSLRFHHPATPAWCVRHTSYNASSRRNTTSLSSGLTASHANLVGARPTAEAWAAPFTRERTRDCPKPDHLPP
jgi:hypothetical protein